MKSEQYLAEIKIKAYGIEIKLEKKPDYIQFGCKCGWGMVWSLKNIEGCKKTMSQEIAEHIKLHLLGEKENDAESG